MANKLKVPASKKNRLKPDLEKALFWDVRYEEMDWQRCYSYIIERVLDRGTDAELDEIIRFYGKDKVVM